MSSESDTFYATQVVTNLQRQQVQSWLIACNYLEANIDLMDILVAGKAVVEKRLTNMVACYYHVFIALSNWLSSKIVYIIFGFFFSNTNCRFICMGKLEQIIWMKESLESRKYREFILLLPSHFVAPFPFRSIAKRMSLYYN